MQQHSEPNWSLQRENPVAGEVEMDVLGMQRAGRGIEVCQGGHQGLCSVEKVQPPLLPPWLLGIPDPRDPSNGLGGAGREPRWSKF